MNYHHLKEGYLVDVLLYLEHQLAGDKLEQQATVTSKQEKLSFEFAQKGEFDKQRHFYEFNHESKLKIHK